MVNNSEIRFCYDTMIVETILSQNKFIKNANIISDMTESVKNYVSNHINPNDKLGSLLEILAPGAISVTFSAMGLGWIGVLISFGLKAFDINVGSIFSSIYNDIKGLLSNHDAKISSSQIDNIVNNTMQAHIGSSIEDDSQVQIAAFQQQLKDAKIIKLALINYNKQLIATDNIDFSFFKLSYSRRGKYISVLGKVISWIFKVALASAGFMVAGDAVNKVLNKPNAFDGSLKDNKPTNIQTVVDKPITTQTKFPVNKDYVDTQYNVNGTNWIEKINNSKSSIENMLVNFTKEVYDGLEGEDNIIRSTPQFKVVADNIAWYNHSAAGDPIVFIPKMFVSKKQLVDHFIDSVSQLDHSKINQNKSDKPIRSYSA